MAFSRPINARADDDDDDHRAFELAQLGKSGTEDGGSEAEDQSELYTNEQPFGVDDDDDDAFGMAQLDDGPPPCKENQYSRGQPFTVDERTRSEEMGGQGDDDGVSDGAGEGKGGGMELK